VKYFLVLIVCMVIGVDMTAQEPSEYVVFTFERKLKGKDLESYYWIAEVDSIRNLKFPINPLYIDSVSNLNLNRCIDNDTISWQNNYDGADSNYISTLQDFLNLNKRNRRKIQEIATKWYDTALRVPEKVIIYAFPVKGCFCQCYQVYQYGGSSVREFEGHVFMPLSGFSYIPSFWDREAGKIVQFANYIFIDFTRFTPSVFQDRRRCEPIEKW